MYRSVIRWTVGVGLLVALLARAPAQDKPAPDKPGKPPPKDPRKEDYRELFKTPTTIPEFWDAIRFELEVGRPDIAALHLHEMLKLPAEDKDWVALEEKVGTAAFLRLRTTFLRYQSLERTRDPKLIDQAVDDARDLSMKVTKALEKVLGDRGTILRHIKELSGDREERKYAFNELYRSKSLAVPALIAELQSSRGEEHDALMELLVRLHPDTVKPLLAALDAPDDNLRLDLIEVLMRRRAAEAVPELWHLAASRSDRVRDLAREALVQLTTTERAKLPPAEIPLTRLAERYHRHQVPLENNAIIWRWDDKAKEVVKGAPVTASAAEEYYGLRFARQALDADPAYAPAQQVLLALLLEKAAERAGTPDAPLPKDVRELLATVNPDLVNQVLERALTDGRTRVALGAVRALGDVAETRALKPTGHGEPALVRALSYPDRRVQMAAADALLHIPASPSPTAAARVVDVLARFAAIDPQPKGRRPVVLLGFADDEVGQAIERAARQNRFDVERLASGTAVLERLKKSADVDAILIGTQLPDPGLVYLLAQLRQDAAFAGLPLWLVIPWDTQESLKERQVQVEGDVYAFRRRKQRLLDERKRTEDLYLNTKGAAATPYKVRLDQIDKELKGFTEEQEEVLLRARKTVERQLLSAPPAREPALRRLLDHYRHTWLLAESAARDATFLGRALSQPAADVAGEALTGPESKAYAEQALEWLARMARGEVAGYDISPAEAALYRALQAQGLGDNALKAAIEATARLPVGRGGDKPQRELATVVLGNRPPAVRATAATELLRRIQRSTPALTRAEVQKLEELRGAPGTDEKLREAVALVIGATRPDARLTGERLKGFEPKPPAKEAPPAPPKEEEKKP